MKKSLFASASVALSLAASSAFAVGPLSVEERVELKAPPAKVWAIVGNFGSLGWHPAVKTTQITQGRVAEVGAVREITMVDGAKIIETLEAREEAKQSLRYRIESSPLPVNGYVSTIRVEPNGAGSRVVWRSSFVRDPKVPNLDDAQARDVIAGVYKGGFEGLRKQLGEAPQ